MTPRRVRRHRANRRQVGRPVFGGRGSYRDEDDLAPHTTTHAEDAELFSAPGKMLVATTAANEAAVAQLRAAGADEFVTVGPRVDIDAELCQRQPGIPAVGHPGGAGVILFAGKGDPVLPDTDDGSDDANTECTAFERPALLDVGLQISDMAAALGLRARTAGKACLAERVAHGSVAVAVARGIDVALGHATDVGSAAQEAAEMTFLVAPRRDFDGAFDARVGIDDSGGLQRIDDAQRAIEPARVILAFEMRSRQQFRP